MRVYVVTGLNLGWDCVVGVYSCDEVSLEQLQNEWPVEDFIIIRREVETQIM